MKHGMCLDEQLIKILFQKIISSSDFFSLFFFFFLFQKRNLKYRLFPPQGLCEHLKKKKRNLSTNESSLKSIYKLYNLSWERLHEKAVFFFIKRASLHVRVKKGHNKDYKKKESKKASLASETPGGSSSLRWPA